MQMKKYLRSCRNCGCEFFTNCPRVFYCCDECKEEGYRKKHQSSAIAYYKRKQKKKTSSLDERARILKETGMKACILEAYSNEKELQRVKFYYYEHGLAKPCKHNERREIGRINRR